MDDLDFSIEEDDFDRLASSDKCKPYNKKYTEQYRNDPNYRKYERDRQTAWKKKKVLPMRVLRPLMIEEAIDKVMKEMGYSTEKKD